jgi:hypothetical protein
MLDVLRAKIVVLIELHHQMFYVDNTTNCIHDPKPNSDLIPRFGASDIYSDQC